MTRGSMAGEAKAVLAACLLVLAFGAAASSEPADLDGDYLAADGSRLVVEALRIPRSGRLNLILRGVEMSVVRHGDRFVFRRDGCELTFVARQVGAALTITVRANGICVGPDAAFTGLTADFVRR